MLELSPCPRWCAGIGIALLALGPSPAQPAAVRDLSILEDEAPSAVRDVPEVVVEGGLAAPELAPIGAPDWLVFPGRVRRLTGPDAGSGADLEGDELAWALRHAAPGEVIGLQGDHSESAPIIGGGKPGAARAVVWAERGPVRDVTVTGLDPDFGTTLGGVSFRDDGGGWDGLRFHNLTFVNAKGARSPVMVDQRCRGGSIWLTSCRFKRAPKNTTFGGLGAKWWIRAHGGCALYVYDVDVEFAAQEHFLYIDNAEELVVVNCHNRIAGGKPNFGRTFIQHATRADSSRPPPAWRGIYLENVTARGIDVSAGGGSAITVAGYPGTVHLKDVRGLGHTGGQHASAGFLAVWAPEGQNSLFLDDRGFAVQHLILEDVVGVYPEASRPAIMISGVGETDVYGGWLSGQQGIFEYDSRYGGMPSSGDVEFHLDRRLSRYKGYRMIRSWEVDPETGQGRYRRWGKEELDAHTRIVDAGGEAVEEDDE